MTVISITHTFSEGTLLDGTSRGDGTAQVIKPLGWRWGRDIGVWYLRNSRGLSKPWLINRTSEALIDAGHVVTIEVDDTPVSTAEVEAAKAERAENRAEGLAAKADRRRSQADAEWEKDKRLHDALPPLGEPIKVGHHSEGRHRRALDKAWNQLGKAVGAEKEAEEAARRADVAAAATDHRNAPVTVANRIEKLKAEVRGHQRTLAGKPQWTREAPYRLVHVKPEGAYRERLLAALAVAEDQLSYWETVRAQQVAAGVATNYGKETVAKGDFVYFRRGWYEVKRANAKTVSISCYGPWTDTIPWHEISGHRKAEQKETTDA